MPVFLFQLHALPQRTNFLNLCFPYLNIIIKNRNRINSIGIEYLSKAYRRESASPFAFIIHLACPNNRALQFPRHEDRKRLSARRINPVTRFEFDLNEEERRGAGSRRKSFAIPAYLPCYICLAEMFRARSDLYSWLRDREPVSYWTLRNTVDEVWARRPVHLVRRFSVENGTESLTIPPREPVTNHLDDATFDPSRFINAILQNARKGSAPHSPRTGTIRWWEITVTVISIASVCDGIIIRRRFCWSVWESAVMRAMVGIKCEW